MDLYFNNLLKFHHVTIILSAFGSLLQPTCGFFKPTKGEQVCA